MNRFQKIFSALLAVSLIGLAACSTAHSHRSEQQASSAAVSFPEISSPQGASDSSAVWGGPAYCLQSEGSSLCGYTEGIHIQSSEEEIDMRLDWDEVGISSTGSSPGARQRLAVAVIWDSGHFVYADIYASTGDYAASAFMEASWRYHHAHSH